MAFKSCLFFLLFACSVLRVCAKTSTCNKQQPCSCDFTKENDIGVQRTEVLAGAVGALSPLLVAGLAMGVRKLMKSKGPSANNPDVKMERKGSDMSDDSYAGHNRRRPRKSSVTPDDNDFRRRDDFYSRRGSTPLSLSYIEGDFDDDYLLPSDLNQGHDSWRVPGTSGATSRSRPRDNLNSWM